MQVTTVKPAAGREITTYDAHTDADIATLLDAAHVATGAWGRTPLDQRVDVVRSLADLLRRNSSDLAGLVTEEMGKPLGRPAASSRSRRSRVTLTRARRTTSLTMDHPRRVG